MLYWNQNLNKEGNSMDTKNKTVNESSHPLLQLICANQDTTAYLDLNWHGSLTDYLTLVQNNPKVSRTAFQRVYDMVLSHGTEEYTEYKKKIRRFKFFDDPFDNGKDAIFGADIHLMRLVNAFQSAARRYGTEKRILMLHGPVGSAKSTVVRLLKKGLEHYSRRPEGALYSFSWMRNGKVDTAHIFGSADEIPCPMHEEPIRLVPLDARQKVLD